MVAVADRGVWKSEGRERWKGRREGERESKSLDVLCSRVPWTSDPPVATSLLLELQGEAAMQYKPAAIYKLEQYWGSDPGPHAC